MMNEKMKKALAEVHREPIMLARKLSVHTDKGRIFLLASAHAYGYEVDENCVVMSIDGKVLDKTHEDYISLTMRAERHAQVDSDIGADVLKDAE